MRCNRDNIANHGGDAAMGLKGKKKKEKKTRKGFLRGGSEKAPASGAGGYWDREDGRRELFDYLLQYKEGTRCARSFMSILPPFASVPTLSWTAFYRRFLRSWLSTPSPDLHYDQAETRWSGAWVLVGGVRLPRLAIRRHPCLAFPSSLSSKQRKIVHEICTEIDLFHCTMDRSTAPNYSASLSSLPRTSTAATIPPDESSAGDGDGSDDPDGGGGDGDRNNRSVSGSGAAPSCRTVFVSRYADGFDSLLARNESGGHYGDAVGLLLRRQGTVPAYKFVSWFSKRRRREQNERRSEKQSCELQSHGKDWEYRAPKHEKGANDPYDSGDLFDRDRTHLVKQLQDQPGRCIRPNVDTLDFGAMENATLDSLPSLTSSPDWTLVDTPQALDACLRELATATEIGFDLEAYNRSRAAQLTCLIQLKAGDTGREYVIDPLAPGMWDRMYRLRSVFENERVVKIGHSIGSLDVRCLHRDFGIWVVNAFDTYEAARVLRLHASPNNAVRKNSDGTNGGSCGEGFGLGLGLTNVCQHYGSARVLHHQGLKTEYQRCDWRARPLTGDMLEYARLDVRYLIGLRTLMMRDLTRSELYDLRLEQLRRESRLVAEALEATARMEDAYQLVLAQPTHAIAAESGGVDGGHVLDAIQTSRDEETFKTSHQREAFSARQSLRSVGDDGYFTPASSLSIGSHDEVEDEDGMNALFDPLVGRKVLMSPSVVASADTLRVQPLLLKVLARSQERCLSLWSPPKQDTLEKSLLDLWFSQQRDRSGWDESNVHLYLDLVDWRTNVSNELGCSEEFVAELEFLVHVAWRKPASLWALRRVTWNLPDVLVDFEQYRTQLLGIVKKYRDESSSDGVHFYRNEMIRLKRKKALLTTTVLACTAMVITTTVSRLLKRR